MECPIRTKLEVARDVLSGCGDALREGLSVVHSRAVCALLKPIAASLDDNQKSELSHVISAVPWFDAVHGDHVQKALLEGCKYTVAHVKAKRRDMQNLKGFTHYFTEAEWNDILNGESTFAAKLDCICMKLVNLSGRCIDEHTKIEATELWLQVCGLNTVDSPQKVKYKDALTKNYKRIAARAADPDVYLLLLPAQPSQLKAQHPALYEKVYHGGGPPVRCKISDSDFVVACSSTKCRNPEVTKTVVPKLSLGMGQNSDLESFGVMLFKGMQQMQENQAKMMDVMLNGGRLDRGPHTLRDVKPPSEPSRRMLMPPPRHEPIVIMPPPKVTMLPITNGAHETTLQKFPDAHVVQPPAGLFDAAPTVATPSRPDDAELKRRRERAAAFAKKTSVDPPPKRPCVGDVITAMLKERTKEQAKASKEAGKTATAQVEAKAAATPKSPNAAKANVEAKAAATPKRPVAAAGATPAKVAKTEIGGIDWRPVALEEGAARFCKTCYHHHTDRREIVLRSGFRGLGQSKTMKYGRPDSEFVTADAAVAAAQRWVQGQSS
jgi:hypothetical protein